MHGYLESLIKQKYELEKELKHLESQLALYAGYIAYVESEIEIAKRMVGVE